MEASQNEKKLWKHLFWVFGGAILGMLIAIIFAGILRLERNIFLIPYVLLICAFLYCYTRWSNINLKKIFSHNWGWGLIVGIVVSVLIVKSVLMQPSSPTPQGFDLLLSLIWSGLIYGAIDGLLLSILPVIAVLEVSSGWTNTWPKRIGLSLLALIISMFVIAIYHLGYPEFQNAKVFLPVFGVGVMTLSYIITRSPIAPVLSHIAMHIAAVIHGLNTVVQLPPHY